MYQITFGETFDVFVQIRETFWEPHISCIASWQPGAVMGRKSFHSFNSSEEPISEYQVRKSTSF